MPKFFLCFWAAWAAIGAALLLSGCDRGDRAFRPGGISGTSVEDVLPLPVTGAPFYQPIGTDRIRQVLYVVPLEHGWLVLFDRGAAFVPMPGRN